MKGDKKNNSPFEYERHNNRLKLVPIEAMTIENASAYEDNFKIDKELSGLQTLEINFGKIPDFDSYFIIFTNSLQAYCKENNIEFETSGMTEELKQFKKVVDSGKPAEKKQEEEIHFLKNYIQHIGRIHINLAKDSYELIEFFGLMMAKSFRLLYKPGAMRWQDFPFHFTRTGVNAVPITVLIVFLIGIISGYQGSLQLEQFGADIYIADLVGISITRELSPLMVAILVAGRSGSAFSAELGTMKVSEEVDALKSLGFDIFHFLIQPRVLAVTLAMPILTLICNIAGIAGGLVAAITTLDLTISAYMNELQIAVGIWDVMTGLIKSVVFGFLIATIGCFRGLQVSGGAESVGKYTTTSVVSGVFMIIFVDSIFVFIFQALGI
ncbi:MAG: MlaE family ABC transporter permease [Candidatus Kapaibacterium sp.]